MLRLKRGPLSILLALAIQVPAIDARSEQPPSACQWNGPPVEWVLARHPRSGEISGSLGFDIVPFLHRGGIPVSFVSTAAGDDHVRLEVGPASTLQEVLREIVRQAPEYRYGAVEGRIVIYPKGEIYDAPVDIGQVRKMTRAQALFFVLEEGLRTKTNAAGSVQARPPSSVG